MKRFCYIHEIGLSFVVAFSSAAGIALAMIGVAFYQLLQDPNQALSQLFLQHLVHVLLLGALIHLVSWVVLRLILTRRLDQIYLHLYGIGEGKLQPLKIKTRVRELKLIVDGINLMVWRIGRSLNAEAFKKAEEDLKQLKQSVHRVVAENPAVMADLTDNMDSLEQSLLSLTQQPATSDQST